MIRISCTNCKTILTIDDAFAGGVCRCQHCGTIQTVPARARESGAVAISGQSMGGGKPLYQNDARSGTGLDELAGIVVSSGLASSRLTRSAPVSKNSKNLKPLFLGAGGIILVLLIVILYLAMRTAAPSQVSTGSDVSQAPGTHSQIIGAPVAPTPNFCGTKLEGSTVAYLLDCGVATQDFLGDLKDATVHSIGSLGSDHKFQIVFWSNGNDLVAYPNGSTTYATKESIDAARNAIKDQLAFGQSDVIPALKTALEQRPDVIVLATGKGWDLESKWVTDVMTARGRSSVRIDTFNLGSDDSAPLKSLATQTGGTYRTLTNSDLRGE